jgi:hypothetical protein
MSLVDAAPATDQLVGLLAAAAAEAAAQVQPRQLPLCLTYDEAAVELRVGKTKIADLVAAGVLDRPDWSRTECRVRVVSTASVARAAGWPVTPLEVAVPAA